jgi:hypothetical protein
MPQAALMTHPAQSHRVTIAGRFNATAGHDTDSVSTAAPRWFQEEIVLAQTGSHTLDKRLEARRNVAPPPTCQLSLQQLEFTKLRKAGTREAMQGMFQNLAMFENAIS